MRLFRLVLVAFVTASLLFDVIILWESRRDIAAGYGDFIIFYTGAQIIKDRKTKDLFKVEVQNAYQAKFNVPQFKWPLPFNHAPYELFLFLPLAHLSYPLAHAIWSGVNLVLLAIMLQWLLSYVQLTHSFFIKMSVLAWFPTMETFRSGQDSILSAALLLGVFAALKQKRDGWAGFLLALGLYKPQLVLPMAGVCLAARQWRIVAVFSITGATLALVSLSMVGQQGAFDLISILRSMEQYSFIVRPALMPNVRGMTYILLHSYKVPWGIVAAIVTSLVLYAICLYLWRDKFDVLDPVFDLKFSLVVTTTVLISYHLYAHDLILLAVPVILLCRYVKSNQITHHFVLNAFIVLLLIITVPLFPRYLVQIGAFGWWALPIFLLYTILTVEIFSARARINSRSGNSENLTGSQTAATQSLSPKRLAGVLRVRVMSIGFLPPSWISRSRGLLPAVRSHCRTASC